MEYEARHNVCIDFKRRSAIWLNIYIYLLTRIIRKYVHDFVKAGSIVHNKQSLLKVTLIDLF
jgi:hypothetical protein